MANVSMHDLSKTYPGQSERATDQVRLEVGDGEFVVLLGPSGCGKTTLLRMIAGLELPDSGSVAIGGRDVTYLPPRQRNLSMVFQSYAVFPHRRVRANIGFGLAMRGYSKEVIRTKVNQAAEMLQLTKYLDRFPAQLSGGQRQRVAVARAIVVDADVLLMDEPLSNLDALLRLSFRTELKKIVQELGTTTMYVTHDQAEALSLGDRVAVMRDGQIVQIGDPIEVYDHPADTFVGGFLGSPPMNFVQAQVLTEHGSGVLQLGDQAVPAPTWLAAYANKPVVLGIRAESIAVASTPSEHAVQAHVDVVEPIGSAILLTVHVGDEVLQVQAPPTFQIKHGTKVWLQLPTERMHFYDSETSMALVSS